LTFRCLSRCVVMSSFTLCGMWWSDGRRWSFVFFLFSLLTCQIHHYPLCFLFFNPSPHFLYFLFRYRSFYISVFVLQFIVRFVFHSSPFFIFSLAFLFKFFWLSISSFNQSFCYFIFFQFDPDFFDLFFLLLKLFSQINLTIQLKFFFAL
jgi:hypothetical protein